MASQDRTPVNPLIERILEVGYRYSFFQVVRLLQTLTPDSVPIGHQGPPSREAVRFRPWLEMAFPASDVVGVEALAPGEPTEDREPIQQYQVTTTFMSLYGAVSPLPAYYSEEIIEQDQDDEGSLSRGFLDLFHHRAISLFYRTWEKYRYAVQYRADGSDPYSHRFLTLLALDPHHTPVQSPIAPSRLLAYAGLISQHPRSAATLCGVLQDWFDRDGVEITQCVARWIEIPEGQRTALGRRQARLGHETTLGNRVYDRGCTFRLTIRTNDLEDFRSFLPPGERRRELRELLSLLNNDCLDCELALEIAPEEIPELRLSDETAQLGWSTWLGRRPSSPAQVTFLLRGWS